MHCLCTCFPKTVTVAVANCEECNKLLCLEQIECLHFQNNTEIPQLKGECFSRTSLKDEIIISSFLAATLILVIVCIFKMVKEEVNQTATIAYQEI